MDYQNGQSRARETKVILNIYNLHNVNYYLHAIGLGFYHTGIQINDVEYSFGGHDGSSTGVCECRPRTSFPEGTFRNSLELGTTRLTSREIIGILDQLKGDFPGNSYNVITRNCNHFSNEVSKRVLGKGIPGYVNRLACIGSVFKCCIPKELMKGPQQETASATTSRSKPTTTTKVFGSRGIQIGGASKTPAYGFSTLKNEDTP